MNFQLFFTFPWTIFPYKMIQSDSHLHSHCATVNFSEHLQKNVSFSYILYFHTFVTIFMTKRKNKTVVFFQRYLGSREVLNVYRRQYKMKFDITLYLEY